MRERRGGAIVVVKMDIFQLCLQLRWGIADLASIEFEIGMARAVALLPLGARRRFPQAWRDVLQPRHLDLQLRLAAMRMTMENLHYHSGSIKYLRAGRTLEVACLAPRDVMIDDHELQLRARLQIGLDLR